MSDLQEPDIEMCEDCADSAGPSTALCYLDFDLSRVNIGVSCEGALRLMNTVQRKAQECQLEAAQVALAALTTEGHERPTKEKEAIEKLTHSRMWEEALGLLIAEFHTER